MSARGGRADIVGVMESGNLVELGTQRELAKAGGTYPQLYDAWVIQTRD